MGRLLELRPLRPEHFDDLYAVASDPLIWEQHPAHDRHEEPVFCALFRESLASGGALVALDAATGNVVGSSRFHGYDREKSEIEIGWTFLARSHWGGAYNREMKDLMLRHAFRFVRRVIFWHAEFPLAMRTRKDRGRPGRIEAGRYRADELRLRNEGAMIRKLASGKYRLYSRKKNPRTGKRRNLGTFKTRAAALRHERAIQYFKRH